MDKIKFPNSVVQLSEPQPDRKESIEELMEKLPDWEKEISDPAILARVHKVIRLTKAEEKMGQFRDSLAFLIWEIMPDLKKSDIDIYFIYRDRIFLICWKCLCVWSHIVEHEERLPDNFGICPNGCNSTDGLSKKT